MDVWLGVVQHIIALNGGDVDGWAGLSAAVECSYASVMQQLGPNYQVMHMQTNSIISPDLKQA